MVQGISGHGKTLAFTLSESGVFGRFYAEEPHDMTYNRIIQDST